MLGGLSCHRIFGKGVAYSIPIGLDRHPGDKQDHDNLGFQQNGVILLRPKLEKPNPGPGPTGRGPLRLLT